MPSRGYPRERQRCSANHTATNTPTARITPYMWKGPRSPLDGLGIDPSSMVIARSSYGGWTCRQHFQGFRGEMPIDLVCAGSSSSS